MSSHESPPDNDSFTALIDNSFTAPTENGHTSTLSTRHINDESTIQYSVASRSSATPTTEALIMIPPTNTIGNLPKNKKKACYCVSKDKVNMLFRVGVDNYSNIIPQMSKRFITTLAINTRSGVPIFLTRNNN